MKHIKRNTNNELLKIANNNKHQQLTHNNKHKVEEKQQQTNNIIKTITHYNIKHEQLKSKTENINNTNIILTITNKS